MLRTSLNILKKKKRIIRICLFKNPRVGPKVKDLPRCCTLCILLTSALLVHQLDDEIFQFFFSQKFGFHLNRILFYISK